MEPVNSNQESVIRKNTYVLYTRDMAIAYAAGKKTQTMRLIKLPKWSTGNWNDFELGENKEPLVICKNTGCLAEIVSPYGQPGDRLTFLTTWKTLPQFDDYKPSELPRWVMFWSYFDNEMPEEGKLRPGRFMSKWMRNRMPKSILKGVRVERVQDITREGAIAEGIHVLPLQDANDPSAWWESAPGKNQARNPVWSYKKLWDSINIKTAPWDSNPWVWVLEWEAL